MPISCAQYKTLRTALVCLCVIASYSSVYALTIAIPDGFGREATGGGNASPVTVSTAAQFRSAAGHNDPAVIIVDGRLNIGEFSVGSNKTIIGKDTRSGLYGGRIRVGGTNYIFQNLTIGPSSTDAMELSGATKVFITKCDFYDGADGSLDIVRQSDFVTVSWCKFYYINQTDHKFSILIGNGDEVIADRGKLHVTMHHNWFAEKCNSRMPRVRFGRVHIYNNFYNSADNSYCIGVGVECNIRLENTHFDNVKNPWADYGGTSNGKIGWAGLKFDGCAQPTFMPNTFPVFDLPYPYTMDPVDNVKSIVPAGAGNVMSGPTGVTRIAAISPIPLSMHPPSPMRGHNALGRLMPAKTYGGRLSSVLDPGNVARGYYLFSNREFQAAVGSFPVQ